MMAKARPNHRRYVEILRAMTPEQRLRKAFELTDYARQLMREGLRNRHPGASEAELHRLYLKRLRQCHSKSSWCMPCACSKPPAFPT